MGACADVLQALAAMLAILFQKWGSEGAGWHADQPAACAVQWHCDCKCRAHLVTLKHDVSVKVEGLTLYDW